MIAGCRQLRRLSRRRAQSAFESEQVFPLLRLGYCAIAFHSRLEGLDGDQADGESRGDDGGRCAGYAALVGAARRVELHGHEVRVRDGMCGACTVQLGGKAVRSCMTRVAAVGRGGDDDRGALAGWPAPGAGGVGGDRCAAVRLLPGGADHDGRGAAGAATPHPTDAEIDAAMSGNICRCGTYPRIRQAIHEAAERGRDGLDKEKEGSRPCASIADRFFS